MPRLIVRSLTLALATVFSGGVTLPAHAAPQSDGASRMSQASLEACIAAIRPAHALRAEHMTQQQAAAQHVFRALGQKAVGIGAAG